MLRFTVHMLIYISCKRAHLLSSHPWLLPSPLPSFTPVLPGELARRLARLASVGITMITINFDENRTSILDCKIKKVPITNTGRNANIGCFKTHLISLSIGASKNIQTFLTSVAQEASRKT